MKIHKDGDRVTAEVEESDVAVWELQDQLDKFGWFLSNIYAKVLYRAATRPKNLRAQTDLDVTEGIIRLALGYLALRAYQTGTFGSFIRELQDLDKLRDNIKFHVLWKAEAHS